MTMTCAAGVLPTQDDLVKFPFSFEQTLRGG
jgi:hypothetical protein